MIEVILYLHDERIARVFDIETPEDAVFVARTLWDDDEWIYPIQGRSRARRVQFLVDGVNVRIVEGQRP